MIGSVLIPPIIRLRDRAKMVFYKTGSWKSNTFELSETAGGNWDSTLMLSVRNLGKKTVERFYWEIYVNKSVSVEFTLRQPFPNDHKYHRIEGRDFVRYYGYIQMPIFSYDDIDFVYELKVRTKAKKELKLYYYFRTDNGNSPAYSWLALSFRKHSWLKQLVIN